MSAKLVAGKPCDGGVLPWKNVQNFERILARFGAPYPLPDHRALVSFWSQYYLAALIIPAAVALLRFDRVLPVAADCLGVEMDEAGTVSRFVLRDAGSPCGEAGSRLSTLVAGHLVPFAEACTNLCGLSKRVVWSNAATILSYAIDELADDPPIIAAAHAEARALLLRRGPLRATFRHDEDGARRRRVCCLRYRLAGVPRCADICPLDRPAAAPFPV